jgi:hypothetical protein
MKINIRKLLLINTIIIILSMILVYNLTPDGWEGGTLGKKYGNIGNRRTAQPLTGMTVRQLHKF